MILSDEIKEIIRACGRMPENTLKSSFLRRCSTRWANLEKVEVRSFRDCIFHARILADVTLNPCLRNFRMRSIERASHADRFEDKCLISKSYIYIVSLDLIHGYDISK